MSSASLLDLGPASDIVIIRGKQIPVYGVSALSIFDLIRMFPEVRAIMEQRFQDVTAEKLMAIGPVVVCRIMAMGASKRSDHADDAAWEKHIAAMTKAAMDLSMGDQMKLLSAVLAATMPDGKDPFIAQLNEIKALFSGQESGETSEPVTNSRGRLGETLLRADPNYPSGGPRRVN